MPELATRADSLRLYLTGAASDGGAQADPEASLGGFRSSTEDGGCGFLVIGDALANIRIDHAAHANGTGDGTLATVTDDQVAWTPPGGTQGDAVTILDGESKLVEGDGDPAACVRITRMDDTPLGGAVEVRCVEPFNSVAGFDNLASAEASAGRTEYRAYMIRNVSAVAVEQLKIWIVTPSSGFAYGFEAVGGSSIQTIANETTAPSGITWRTNTTEGSAVAYANIPSGGLLGLWVRRTTSAGTTYTASTLHHLRMSFRATNH